MKKILSFVLSILMVIAIVPVSVFVVSAEETQTLYSNSFDSAEDVTTNATLGTAAYNEAESALQITHSGWNYSNAYWETSIDLNGTDGLITLTTEINADAYQTVSGSTSRGDGAILTVNGKVIIKNITEANGDYKVSLADGTVVQKACSNGYKENITLTIDPKTGKGTLVFDQTAANKVDPAYVKTTTVEVDLGTIGESITVRYGKNRHADFYVYSLNVTQVEGNEFSAEEPEVLTNTLLEVGAISYSSNSTNSFNEYTVTTNGTDGKITISFVTGNANWQYNYNILSVNGKALITANGTSGNSGYTLGANSDVIYTWNGRTYTVEIDPLEGVATIDDGKGNSATVNVGSITESFTMTVGSAYSNGWNLSSINVTQIVGSTHTCEYETVVTPASCKAPEFTVKTCKDCGKSTSTATAPVLGHTWGEWTKSGEASTRSCSVCSATETKTVGEIDTSKTFLAIGDSLTYALNTPNTINDSWAKKVADSLGMSDYINKAVHGSEAYHWYSLLTGGAAPNGTTYKLDGLINSNGLAFDPSFDKAAMTAAIESASVVAFTLGSNDMSKGYLQWRTPAQIQSAIIGLVDKIHEINPDAVVIVVGYAYGLLTTTPVDGFIGSYQHFIDLDALLSETLNSGDYNSFAYYVDVSKTMSDTETQGKDLVHPTAAGHVEMANDVIAALGSIDALAGGTVVVPDTTSREESDAYVNHFDGTTPTAGVVSWGATGTDGVLTVAPSEDPNENRLNVGSVNFPGNTVISFKFNIPQLPESGTINIFHDRVLKQNYVCVFSAVNEETGATEFWASVGNNNDGNNAVQIKENEWYTVTILFAPNASSYSSVYIDGQFIGTVKGTVIGNTAGWGFANFAGCDASSNQNAAAYQIDDFTASTFADESLVKITGFQKTKVVDGSYNVRFVAAINGILSSQTLIGFEIVAHYTDEDGVNQDKMWDLTTKTVYNSITAKYGTEEITAASVGGKYVTTAAITSIDDIYDSVEFEVRPYVTVNGVKYYGTIVTITVHPEA